MMGILLVIFFSRKMLLSLYLHCHFPLCFFVCLYFFYVLVFGGGGEWNEALLSILGDLQTCYSAKDDFDPLILLPLYPKCWSYRHVTIPPIKKWWELNPWLHAWQTSIQPTEPALSFPVLRKSRKELVNIYLLDRSRENCSSFLQAKLGHEQISRMAKPGYFRRKIGCFCSMFTSKFSVTIWETESEQAFSIPAFSS